MGKRVVTRILTDADWPFASRHPVRQIESGSFLGNLGGRQVDRQAPHGEVEAGVPNRRPDPLACLLNGPIGQTHDREVGQAGILSRAAF
jgi:hypothetical protein